MKIEKVIARARKIGRVDPQGLALCENCDTLASKSLSMQLSWLCCGPCATGESDSFDADDLIDVNKQAQGSYA